MARIAFCLLSSILLIGCSEPPAPAPSGDAPTPAPEPVITNPKTNAELVTFLKQKGIVVGHGAIAALDKPDRPVSFFWEGDESGGPRAIVYLCPDRETAYEAAGRLGDDGFVYGRFAIGPANQSGVNKWFARKLKKALGEDTAPG